jgi:two-component system, OmpR family, copper resistance phosphate regulon response regulator CusR
MLVVEDEHRLADRLARGLREEGFAVDVTPTVALARELASSADYDLVLLDLKLPDGSGLDLLAEWRHDGIGVPILVLTAKDLLDDKVRGLRTGADDYLTKPFSFAELVARIQALLRRSATPLRSILEVGDLRVDRGGHRAERGGRTLELTAKEFALLEFMALHTEQVLSRATIAEHVWDVGYDAQSNVIDVIVGRLRRKLEAGGASRLLHTVGGVGYTLRRG